MKKSAYVHCALISAALASCNRPLYQQTAPEGSTRYVGDDAVPAAIPDPSPGGYPGTPGGGLPDQNFGQNDRRDTLSWLPGKELPGGDSCWYYAFRDIDLNWQIYTGTPTYRPPYRGRWFRMPFAHMLRSGFGRPAFHAGA